MKKTGDLIDAVAKSTGKTKKEVIEVYNAIEKEIKAIVTEHDAIRLNKFIEIGYKLKPARNVRNPRTGEIKMSEPKDSAYTRFFGSDWHSTTREE